MSALDPAGETAREIANLWWLMLALGSAVMLIVLAVLARVTFRSRQRDPGRWMSQRMVIAGGVVLPVVVLLPLLLVWFRVGDKLSHQPADGDLAVEVVGEQFWWRISYPGTGAVTANELHVPVGRPVNVVMTSADVIHSFWVPNVAGKVDLIPGETTRLRFTVDRPGVYRGACAEYCGIQHAHMRVLLIAQPEDEFEKWVRRTASDAAVPGGDLAEEGRRVFAEVGCGTCHAVRGTESAGAAGPDLTHLASRRTIGAGVATNVKGNLAGWVLDPQATKPGNRMPAQPLTAAQLEALLAYLEALE